MDSLEEVIASCRDRGDAVTIVRARLRKAYVFALGHAVGQIFPTPRRHLPMPIGTESTLVHFTIDDDGLERAILPLFTRPSLMREALLRNPEWHSRSILQIYGQEMLDNVDPDVTIVINPWSEPEFWIPPSTPS